MSERIPSILESLLFASDRPVGVREMCDALGEKSTASVEEALAALKEDYETRGIQLSEVGGGWQLRTNPENAAFVQKLLAGRPARLSRAAVETLAIVAYRQPVTRAEIDEIRGVDSGGVLHALLGRSLIRILGKKEEPGRPLLYGTTKEFLAFFQLRDLRELPTLREFAELSAENRQRVDAATGGATPSDPGAATSPPAEPSAENESPASDAE